MKYLLENNKSLLNPINYIRFKLHTGRYIQISYMLKEGNLLDIGCGRPAEFMKDGAFLTYINRKDSIGIDIDDLKINNFNFLKTSVLNLPFSDETFDNIVAMEILEHVENVEAALSEIRRVLKKDGLFIMTTPDNSILWKITWSLWINSFGRMWRHKHIIEYSPKEWIKVISKYFKIIEIKKYFLFTLIFRCRK